MRLLRLRQGWMGCRSSSAATIEGSPRHIKRVLTRTGRMMDLLESGGRPMAAERGHAEPGDLPQPGHEMHATGRRGGRRSLQIHAAEHRAIMAHDRGYDRRDGSAMRESRIPRRPG